MELEFKKQITNYLHYNLMFQLQSDLVEEFEGEDWFEDEEIFKKGALWKLRGINNTYDLNISIGEGYLDGFLLSNDTTYVNFHYNIKPVLKPLSDLIDNILEDWNDDNYQLNCELAEILVTIDASNFVKSLIENKYYAVDIRKWNDIEEFLNKNHFDWKYDLIKKGLAININTLK